MKKHAIIVAFEDLVESAKKELDNVRASAKTREQKEILGNILKEVDKIGGLMESVLEEAIQQHAKGKINDETLMRVFTYAVTAFHTLVLKWGLALRGAQKGALILKDFSAYQLKALKGALQ